MSARKKSGQANEQQEKLVPESEVATTGEVLASPVSVETNAHDLSEETLLPVTGMVRLSRRELTVIDHPAFQRLFEIYQLGQTYLVYRGATHMRGEHAIGSVEAAMLMVAAIDRNRARDSVLPSERWQRAPALSPDEVAFVRLGALLHDIGHLPAGHTLEDELGLLPSHDGDERIDFLLDREKWHGLSSPSLREVIDESYADEAKAAGQRDEGGNAVTASQLLVRLISSDHGDVDTTPGTDFRIGVCRDIIGNTICADLIDYLHRDWMHIGKPKYFDPRLLDYMQILTRTKNSVREDRLVIHLGTQGRPRPDAVTAILDLLESRYQLSEIALFHRVKLAATGMLERVIGEHRDTFDGEEAQKQALENLIPDLLECCDAEVTNLLERELGERRTKANAKRVDAAVELARRLRLRKLHQDFHAVYASDLPAESVAQIAERYSGDPELSGEEARVALRRAAENRLLAVRALEYEFDLPPCSVVMYCPPLQMNSKIAEVGIYSKGIVGSLASLDRDERISGGYLRAQQERFQRLWRISFALDRDVRRQLEEKDLLDQLRLLIDRTTLWVPTELDDSAEVAVRNVAETLVNREASPWFGHELIESGLNREEESIDHPGGAPSARSFISAKTKST